MNHFLVFVLQHCVVWLCLCVSMCVWLACVSWTASLGHCVWCCVVAWDQRFSLQHIAQVFSICMFFNHTRYHFLCCCFFQCMTLFRWLFSVSLRLFSVKFVFLFGVSWLFCNCLRRRKLVFRQIGRSWSELGIYTTVGKLSSRSSDLIWFQALLLLIILRRIDFRTVVCKGKTTIGDESCKMFDCWAEHYGKLIDYFEAWI